MFFSSNLEGFSIRWMSALAARTRRAFAPFLLCLVAAGALLTTSGCSATSARTGAAGSGFADSALGIFSPSDSRGDSSASDLAAAPLIPAARLFHSVREFGGEATRFVFEMAGPSSAKPTRTEMAAERRIEESEFDEAAKPAWYAYPLYVIIGLPRDLVAIPLELTGYAVGTVLGTVCNVVVVFVAYLYNRESPPPRPIMRSVILGWSCLFFAPSDVFLRSFTGDMDRYRFGVHPFPRADHRFFPNYHAFLGGPSDEQQ